MYVTYVKERVLFYNSLLTYKLSMVLCYVCQRVSNSERFTSKEEEEAEEEEEKKEELFFCPLIKTTFTPTLLRRFAAFLSTSSA